MVKDLQGLQNSLKYTLRQNTLISWKTQYISSRIMSMLRYEELNPQDKSRVQTKSLAEVSEHATDGARGWLGSPCCCRCCCCWCQLLLLLLLCMLLCLLNGTGRIQGPALLQQEVCLPSYCLIYTDSPYGTALERSYLQNLKNKLLFYFTEKYMSSAASQSKNKEKCSSQVSVLDWCVHENRNAPHSDQNSSIL